MKSCPDTQKPKEFIATKLALQEMSRGTSLNWKELALINNSNKYESKNLVGKGKYAVRAEDHL